MKKGTFSGWQAVFSFTLTQATDKKFKTTTAVVAAIFFTIGLAISIILAFVQAHSASKESPIQTVYVVDESELESLNFDSFLESEGVHFPNLSFDYSCDNKEDAAAKAVEQEGSVVLSITHGDNEYTMTCIVPGEGTISEDDGEYLLEALSSSLEYSKMMSSGIPMEKLQVVISGVNTQTVNAGDEEQSLGEEMIKMLLPMIVMLLIYMLTLIYGLTMGNVVSVEKTSKLMEMMLTLTKPAALILGKILAQFMVAVLQALFWIGTLVGGFYLGNFIALTMIYPRYANVLMEAMNQVSQQGDGSAFSAGAIILFVLAICIGFLFFCLIAATFGSLASKTEDLGQAMGIYQIITVFSFLGAYLVPMQEVAWMSTVTRLIPFTAAFVLPGDILVGNITLLQGVLYLLLLLVFTGVFVVITGKMYMARLFYRGKSIKDFFRKKNGQTAEN